MAICRIDDDLLGRTKTVIEKLVFKYEDHYDFDKLFVYIYEQFKGREEQFARVIVAMASQYYQFDLTSKPRFKVGKAFSILTINNDNKTLPSFIREVYTLYNIKTSVSSDSGSELNTHLDKMISSDTEQEIIDAMAELLVKFKRYLIDNKEIVSQEQIDEAYLDIRNKLITLATTVKDPRPVRRAIDNHFPNVENFITEEDLKKARLRNTDIVFSTYIDPAYAIEELGYTLYVTTDPVTGQVYHVYNDNGIYKNIENNQALPEGTFTEPTLALRQGGETVEFFVPNEMLTGGLTFVPLNQVNPDAINDLESQSGLFSIKKIKNPSFGRIGILQSKSFPKEHETFENEAQRSLLRSTPNAGVMNYMNSEDEYIIVAVHQSGQVYELKSAKSLASISEKTIVPITEQNIKENASLLTKRKQITRNGRTEIEKSILENDEDILNLKSGIRLHQELLAQPETDLTKYFYDNFDLTAYLNDKVILLSDYFRHKPAAQFNIKIVQLTSEEYLMFKLAGDKRGMLIGSKPIEEIRVPLLFYKPKADASYQFTNTLPKNSVVVVESNAGVAITAKPFDEFISPILNRIQEIGDVYKSNVTILAQALNGATDLSNLSTYDLTNIAARFVERSRFTSDSKYFSSFIFKVASLRERIKGLSLEDINNAEKELSSNFFVQKSLRKNGEYVFIPNVGFNLKTNAIQIEVNSTYGRLGEFVHENKGSFRHRLEFFDARLWDDIMEFTSFTNLLNMIKDKGMREVIKERVKKAGLNQTLTGSDRVDQEAKKVDLLLYTLYNNIVKIEGFYDIDAGFKELERRWGEVMFKSAERSLNYIKNNAEVAGFSDDLIQELNTINVHELFTREYLVNGEIVHYPEIYPKDVSGNMYFAEDSVKEDFYKNLENYSITQRSSDLTLAVQRGKTLTQFTSEVGPSTQVVNKTEPTNNPLPEDVPKPAKKKLRPGSASGTGPAGSIETQFRTETNPERNDAIKWLHENLPQIGISQEDAQTLITLAAEDGVVLGAFYDRLIYLNKNIKGKGTVYHEAFHGVFRLLLSDEQRQDLLKKIKSDKANSKKFEEAYMKEFAKKRKLVYENSNIQNLVAEEILADAFQEYMINNKKAKQTWMQRVLDIIKDFITKLFYKLQRDIQNELFLDIRNGHFKNSTIKSGLVAGEVALELVSGTKDMYVVNNVPHVQDSYLSPSEQKQIIQHLTHYLLNSRKAELTLDENFEIARQEISKLYSYNSILEQEGVKNRMSTMSEQEQKDYRKLIDIKYGSKYKNIHFILTEGEPTKQDRSYINKTGESSEDPLLKDDEYYGDTTLDDIEIEDDVNAVESLELLKKQVKEYYAHFVTFKEEIPNSEEADEELTSEEDADFNADEEKEARTDPFDSNLFGVNALANVSSEFKRFFSMITYTETDDLGVAELKMIDGQSIFNSFLKMSADVNADQILPTIQRKINRMYYDGYIQEATELQKAFQLLSDNILLDDNFVPAKNGNLKLYNEFIDTMYKTGIELVQLTKSTTETTTTIGGSGVISSVKTQYYFKDSVLETDKKEKKDTLLRNFRLKFVENSKSKLGNDTQAMLDFEEKINQARIAFKRIVTNRNLEIFTDDKLEQTVIDLKKHFDNIGLSMPKSFIKLSLLAIEEKENKNLIDRTRPSYGLYEDNKTLVNSEQYLRKDFFTQLDLVLTLMTSKNFDLSRVNDLIVSRNSPFYKLDLFLKKASTYLVLSDPTDLQSVVLNAEQKPIYRYSSYTPAILMAKDIRINGVERSLMNTPYWKEFLSTWYADHPFIKILNGPITEERKRIEIYLSGLSISVNGGIIEIENNVFRGQSFKSISMSNLYATEILSFLTRKSIVSPDFVMKDGKPIFPKIVTYRKSLAQNEGSNTNFYVTALYKNYMESKETQPFSIVKKFTQGLGTNAIPTIVSNIYDVVEQEYNRIRYQYASRESNLRKHASGVPTLVVDYNTHKEATDEFDEYGNFIANPEVTNNGRAFNFSMFEKMFSVTKEYKLYRKLDPGLPDNSEKFDDMIQSIRDSRSITQEEKDYLIKSINIREDLRDLAFQNKGFDKIPQALKYKLAEFIFETLEREYRTHLGILQSEGLVEGVNLDDPYTGKQAYIHSGVDSQLVFTEELDDPKVKYEGLIEDGGLRTLSLDAFYQSSPSFKGGTISKAGMMLRDKFYNYYYNNITTGQLFESGDKALTVKNSTEEIKRAKLFVASGTTGKRGFYRTAIMKEVKVYMHHRKDDSGKFVPDKIELGQYDELYQVKNRLLEMEYTEEEVNSLLADFKLVPVMDGQAFNHVFHVMQLFEQSGRMDSRAKSILIASTYRKLRHSEISHLKKFKQVLNSKKTVHADLTTYLKHSEHALLRGEVSYIDTENTKEAHRELDKIYSKIFSLKTLQSEVYDENRYVGSYSADHRFAEAEAEIKELYRIAHSYFKPLPGRELLHDMLNKMEKGNIDYVSDTNSSKKATFYPNDINSRDFNAVSDLDFKYKFMQIETSGIKDEAKASVQSKLLLPADREFLRRKLQLEGKTPTEIDKTLSIFDTYNSSLADVVKSKFEFFKQFIANNDTVNIADLFNIIHTSLVERDADINLIKLFEVRNGQPVHSPYLPLISDQLKYYFFSIFSHNLTEEKVSGFKNFLVSSYGQKVVYSKFEFEGDNGVLYPAGTIITREKILADPRRYSNILYYGERYPEVSIEYDESGERTYWAETLIPEPYFKSDNEREFYMDNLTKHFATRIPTEDKRSMIAIKVVDFIDSAYMNSIIVPQWVHLLAGSDFDIDSLYGQSYSYYRSYDESLKVYGNARTNQDKFIEYVHFVSTTSDIKDAVKKHMIEGEKSLDLEKLSEEAKLLLRMILGDDIKYLTPEELEKNRETIETINSLQEDFDIINTKFQSLLAYIDEYDELASESPVQATLTFDVEDVEKRRYELRGKSKTRRAALNKLKDLRAKSNPATQKSYNAQLTAFNVNALFEVLKKKDLPTTVEEFVRTGSEMLVVPAFQNANLTAKLKIISNEDVYNNLYSKERANVEELQDVADVLGRSEEKISGLFDINSPDGQIQAKFRFNSSDTGIGIAANINKALAVMVENGLILSDREIIWKLNGIVHDSFGAQDGERSIAKIGNALGMFADAIKTPLPAALFLNSINTPITLTLIGLGMPVQFAIFMNLIPEIRKSVDYVASEERNGNRKYLSTELEKEIDKIQEEYVGIDKNDTLIEAFARNQLLDRSKSDKLSESKFDRTKYDIIYTPVAEVADPNNPTLRELGISVVGVDGQEFTTDIQKVILLNLYKQQASQFFNILKFGSIMDMFKKLKGDFARFDKIKSTIQELKSNKLLFSNSDTMFKSGKVWSEFEKIVQFIDESSEDVAVSRIPIFKNLIDMISSKTSDREDLAKRLMTNMIVYKFVQEYKLKESQDTSEEPGHIVDKNKAIQTRNDINNFFRDWKVWYNVNNNIIDADLEYLYENYRTTNAFVRFLQLKKNKAPIRVSKNGIMYTPKEAAEKHGLRFTQMSSKTKINNSTLLKEVGEGFEQLYYNYDTKDIASRLLYQEIARSGMSKMKNSYLGYINPDILFKEFSKITNDIASKLKSIPKASEETRVAQAEKELKDIYNAVSKEIMLDRIAHWLEIIEYYNIKQQKNIKNASSRFEIESFSKYVISGNTNEALSKILNFEISKTPKVDKRTGKNTYANLIANEKTRKDFNPKIIDLSPTTNVDVRPEGLNAIARNIGAIAVRQPNSNTITGYIFPMTIDIRAYDKKIKVTSKDKNNYLKLSSIDGVPIEQLMFEAMISGADDKYLTGTKAQYDIVYSDNLPEGFEMGALSMVVLNKISSIQKGFEMINLDGEQKQEEENC